VPTSFDRLDHTVLLGILGDKIHDNRFLRLLRNMLQAGYLEDWDYNATLSGAPQGGVASPILSNIYLDQLDKFVETVLIPQYTRGENRKHNSTYVEVTTALKRARNRGDRTTARQLRKRQRSLPRGDPDDPHYRRLRYARYADDQLLGFTGPKAEAEQIKQRLRTFLHTTLKLELSQDKTLITHARTGAANFLGYQIIVQHADHRRAINGVVGLRVPTDVIKAKCAPYCKLGKPEARTPWSTTTTTPSSPPTGPNTGAWSTTTCWPVTCPDSTGCAGSCTPHCWKTLACKHRSSVSKMAARHKTTISTPYGPRTCLQATVQRTGRKPLTATFGGIPLKRQPNAVLLDRKPTPLSVGATMPVRLVCWRECCCRAWMSRRSPR
jgi:hypothetical protein